MRVAVAMSAAQREMTLRFGMNVPSNRCCLALCAGYVLLITIRKCVGQPYSRAPYPYSVLHTDRLSSAEYEILSAEEETPEQLGTRLISGDIGDHPAMIALPPGPRARGRSPPVTTIVYERPLIHS